MTSHLHFSFAARDWARQHETGPFAGYKQIGNSETPEYLLGVISHPPNVRTVTGRTDPESATSPDTMGIRSVYTEDRKLDGTEHDQHLGRATVVIKSDVNSDVAADEHLSADISCDGDSPRVLAPIDSTFPIPSPAFIPPPPSWVDDRSVQLGPLRPSSQMARSSSKILVQKSPAAMQSHGPLKLPNQTSMDVTSDFQYQKMESSRLECWGLRSRIRTMRRELRQREEDKARADDKLIQRMSMEMFGLSLTQNDALESSKTVADLMDDCRNARGEYGPMEYECNLLEDMLSEQEFELTKLEKEYNIWLKQPHSATEIISTKSPPQHSSPKAFPVSDIEEIPQEHPFVTEFESRLGDLDILQERLIDLEEEREALASERTSRDRFGLSLAYEDQIWLDNSEQLLKEAHDDIRATRADVNRLERRCISYGLLNEDGEPTDLQSRERDTFPDDEDMNSTEQISEYVKHPILLPKPGAKQASVDSHAPDSKEPDGVGGRVSHWLLGQLRESPLEVNLLERTYQKEFGEVDDSWERAVLAVWWDDGTHNAEDYRVYTSSMTSQAHLPSKNSSTPSRVILTHQLYLPPSPEHSDGTENGVSASSLIPSENLHWNQ